MTHKTRARPRGNPFPGRAHSEKPEDDSRQSGPGVKSLDADAMCDFAASLLAKSRLCAEAVLSAGLIDPVALNDTAYLVGVTGADFIEPSHSALFAFCCLSAESGREPRVSEFIPLARELGLDVDQGDFAFQFGHSGNPRELASLCESLREFSSMRERVREISRELGELGVGLNELSDFGGEYELEPDCLAGWRPKVEVVSRRIPPRWRKRGATR